MVPVALGTQTNGSVIRPASLCGVYALKPSRGLLPRTGVLDQSPSLDDIGVFARNLEDIAKVTEIMSGDDGHDSRQCATKSTQALRCGGVSASIATQVLLCQNPVVG